MASTQAALPPWIEGSAAGLARRVAAGEVSAREMVDEALARIDAVDAALNAVAFRRFDAARREADELDAARRRGEALGPLAGVPLSVKECFFLPGTPSTIGVQRFVGADYEEEYAPLARLRAAGAIVVAKTNVPQLMVMHETDNPVYGRTNNPWDLERTPGGSSGGEAALLAAGGAALGIGNDLGGSIRIPAHFCGLAGLKPTSGRLTNVGGFANFRGMEAFQPQSGPLARRVEDVALAWQTMLDTAPRDPRTIPLPWRDPSRVEVDRLRIGWFDDDGYFPASPALRRAVRAAIDALQAAGAEIVPFPIAFMPEALRLYFGLVSADGGADCRRILGRSARDWRVRQLLWLGSLPRVLRGPAAAALRLGGQRRTAELVEWTGARSTDRYWQLTWQLRELAHRFHHAWREAGLDALVCPPHALPALRHGTSAELGPAASYSMLFNVLELPAGVVPVTCVAAGEESDRAATADRIDRLAAQCEQGSAGLPTGVQIVAPAWREDVVLALMQAVEASVETRLDWPLRHTAELPRGGSPSVLTTGGPSSARR